MKAREVKDLIQSRTTNSLQSHTKVLETLLVSGRVASDLAPLSSRREERRQQGLQAPPNSSGSARYSTPKEKTGSQTDRNSLISAFRLPVIIKGSVFFALSSGKFRSLKQVG